MINYNIDFIINKKTIIRICLDCNLNLLNCCQWATIILLHNEKQYSLSTNELKENMFVLKNALEKALLNQLSLHPSISKDVGYLYNEDLQNKSGLVYKKLENTDYWVGRDNLLLGYQFTTWLYNDVDGNIILHITPIYPKNCYPGNYYPEDSPDEIEDEEVAAQAYEVWMLTEYKPFYTTIISPATA